MPFHITCLNLGAGITNGLFEPSLVMALDLGKWGSLSVGIQDLGGAILFIVVNEMIKWIVQSNLRSEAEDLEKIQAACEKYGLGFEGIKAIPFSDDLPEITDKIIPYGGAGWINKIYSKYPTAPGIFFDPKSTFPYWVEKYGENALNFGAKQTTLKKFAEEHYEDDEMFFIRPTTDLKDFSGCVMPFSHIRDWANKIYCVSPGYENLPIVANTPYRIAHEWRLFMINGKAITGSHYRSYFVLHIYDDVPQRVIEFAETQAEIYSPAEAFVMDICESSNKLYVVEIGCINWAGFYASSVDKIVYEVSNLLC